MRRTGELVGHLRIERQEFVGLSSYGFEEDNEDGDDSPDAKVRRQSTRRTHYLVWPAENKSAYTLKQISTTLSNKSALLSISPLFSRYTYMQPT